MIGFLKPGGVVAVMRAVLTDKNRGGGRELVGRHREVERCRAQADAARGIVLRTVAGAEPAAELPARIGGRGAERDAAEMGADADDDQPVLFLHALGVGLPVAQLRDIDGLGFLNLLRRAMGDEDRMAAPHHLDALADLDLADIELGGGEREHVGRGIHLIDQRPGESGDAEAGHADGRQIQEVAAGAAVMGVPRRNTIGHRSYTSSLSAPVTQPQGGEKPLIGETGAPLISPAHQRLGPAVLRQTDAGDETPKAPPGKRCNSPGRARGIMQIRTFAKEPAGRMRLALFEPDIPQNCGTILRLATCLGVAADIIEPCGFLWDNRRLRRSGMDYLAGADVTRHESWAAFLRQRRGRLLLLTTRAERAYLDMAFAADDVLLLGRESAGVPDAVHDA